MTFIPAQTTRHEGAMSVARHLRLSVAAAVLVAALLACTSATAAVAHPSHDARPPVAATRAGHHTTPTPPSRRPPADEAQEYVSLGKAIEHAALQQRHQAARSRRVPSPVGQTDVWRIAALAEASMLAALALTSLQLLRNRRRAQPSI